MCKFKSGIILKNKVEIAPEENDSLARDVTEQAKRNAMRWFFVWLITFAALIGTNAAWIYTFQSYEYVS